MFKVIVERPRLRNPKPCGSAYPRGKIRNLFERDLESAPAHLGMSFPHKQKQLNENLAPLRRFLEKNIGRRWSVVRSEICEHLSVGSSVHMTPGWFGPDERLARWYGRADRFAVQMREPGRRELRLAERALTARAR